IATQRPLRIGVFALTVALLASLPLAADVQKSFDASPGGLLVLEADATKIEIVPGSSNEVTLDLRRRGTSSAPIEDDYILDFSQNGDTVRFVIERRKKRGSWSWREKGLEATITVPGRFDAEVSSAGGSVRLAELQGDVAIRSSGGSIKVGDVDGNIDLDSAGGSITVASVSGKAELDSSGGSITVDRADASVNASTAGGSIRIEEIAGPLQASTSGGSLMANLTETPTSESKLSTSGGSIEVRLAGNVSLDIDARASGGSVNDRVGVDATTKTRTRLVGSVGGGGPLMVLRSSGGSVRLIGD
ncbi:MAG: DUF4097 family beta strand repeat-containing protein, partial [Acidobacteriota bacterium]